MKKIYLFVLLNLFNFNCFSQNSLIGDGFGGRLWYNPTKFGIGSYTAFYKCEGEEKNQLNGWGFNYHNQFGTGNIVQSSVVPIEIPNMDNVEYFSCGYMMGAIKYDKSGWVWGIPGTNGLGSSIGFYEEPFEIISNAKFVNASIWSVSFVKYDGTVWSVGTNLCGKFGNGIVNNNFDSSLIQMNNVSTAVRVSGNSWSTSVLLEDSTLVVSGESIIGLGPEILSTYSPLPIIDIPKVVDIKSHNYGTIALTENGDVYFWGYVEYGDSVIFSPYKLEQLSNIIAISASEDGRHFLALDKDKNCFGWGNNEMNQCGVPNSSFWSIGHDNIQLVATDVIDIMASEQFSYIVKSDGSLWGIGLGRIWLNLEEVPRNLFTKITPENLPQWCNNQIESSSNTNVFSPNGDGVNDLFNFSLVNCENCEIKILNRWGNVVAILDESNSGWDGNDQLGKKCTEGIYFYKLSYNKEGSGLIHKHGFFNLIR
jgi:gliding motility-associated-like protein